MSAFGEEFRALMEHLPLNSVANESADAAPAIDWIRITPAEAFDLLTLASQVDDRTPSEQATLDRLAAVLEKRT